MLRVLPTMEWPRFGSLKAAPRADGFADGQAQQVKKMTKFCFSRPCSDTALRTNIGVLVKCACACVRVLLVSVRTGVALCSDQDKRSGKSVYPDRSKA